MITNSIQTNYTAFLKKFHLETGTKQRKEQAKLILKTPTSRRIRNCLEVQLANDSRLSSIATRECKLVFVTVQKNNPRMGINIFSKSKEKPKDFQMLRQVRNTIKITNRLTSKTGQEDRKQPTAVRAPQRSCQFYCTGLCT